MMDPRKIVNDSFKRIRQEKELKLMTIMKDGTFEEIESHLKPSEFMISESKSFVMGMKVRGCFFVSGLRQVFKNGVIVVRR